jgi:hypothetical protein
MAFDLVTATHESFAPFVGQRFHVTVGGVEIPLLLDNIKRFPNSTIRDARVEIAGTLYPPRESFALTFEGPLEPQLAPDCHSLRHDTLGELVLFVSPFRRDLDCMLYEVVFN